MTEIDSDRYENIEWAVKCSCSSWQLDQVLAASLSDSNLFPQLSFSPLHPTRIEILAAGQADCPREIRKSVPLSVSLVSPRSLALSNRRESAVIEESREAIAQAHTIEASRLEKKTNKKRKTG